MKISVTKKLKCLFYLGSALYAGTNLICQAEASKFDLGQDSVIPTVPSLLQTSSTQQVLAAALKSMPTIAKAIGAKESTAEEKSSGKKAGADRSFYASIQPYSSLTNVTKHSGNPGLRSTTQGLVANTQYKITNSFSLGIMAMTSKLHYKMGHSFGEGNNENVSAGVLGNYDLPSNGYINGAFMASENNFSNNRPTLSGAVARESHKGYETMGALGAGMTVPLCCQINLSPFINMGYVRSLQNKYTEEGVAGHNIHSQTRLSDSLQTLVGGSLSKTFVMDDSIVTPSFSIGYIRDQSLKRRNKAALSFVGSNQVYDINLSNAKSQKLCADIGVLVLKKNAVSLYAGIGGQLNRWQQSAYAAVNIGYRF
ncbi:MAG: autotransporter outer membrane beta-barrel domain-containing protein [Alphaproteobacteria bacterium]|nr:autotransporter outer membrane beta-barrel domain-containing protein [Alphaproteobacteria bacterium]